MKSKRSKPSAERAAPQNVPSLALAQIVVEAAALPDDAPPHAVAALAELLAQCPSLLPAAAESPTRSSSPQHASAPGKRGHTTAGAGATPAIDTDQARRLLGLARAKMQQDALASAVARQRAEIERFVRPA